MEFWRIGITKVLCFRKSHLNILTKERCSFKTLQMILLLVLSLKEFCLPTSKLHLQIMPLYNYAALQNTTVLN